MHTTELPIAASTRVARKSPQVERVDVHTPPDQSRTLRGDCIRERHVAANADEWDGAHNHRRVGSNDSLQGHTVEMR